MQSASLYPIYPEASILFLDESISRSGTPYIKYLSFKVYGDTAISSPVIINAPSGENLLTLSMLNIGGFLKDNYEPFKNVVLIPGAAYIFRVNIVPKDKYLYHEGISSVLINGQIWMRHNLGADTTVNADLLPISTAQHGNFYQWGRKNPLAEGSSNYPSGAYLSSWDPYINRVSWNAGTEEFPVKNTALDPCPDKFRIPTRLELAKLVRETCPSITGNFNNDPNNFGAGMILRSKRNKNIVMTLPSQGAYNPLGVDGDGVPGKPFLFGGIIYRAHWVVSWSSYYSDDIVSRILGMSAGDGTANINVVDRAKSSINTVGAYPIRCIAE